uniref:Uncharacterized protein n=1 Tax=Sciurus vulgaris TaxID=55149 RepID=A0A8D2DVD1_SCIVU
PDSGSLAVQWATVCPQGCSSPDFSLAGEETLSGLMSETAGQKRKRESSTESDEELEELDSELNHPWDVDSLCGLKMKLKKRRINLVLPEHHEVFKRLLEDPVVKRFLAWDKNLRVSDKVRFSPLRRGPAPYLLPGWPLLLAIPTNPLLSGPVSIWPPSSIRIHYMGGQEGSRGAMTCPLPFILFVLFALGRRN